MLEELKENAAIFVVKRYSPEELLKPALVSCAKSLKRPSKSYQTTNDEQRFKFVQKILKKELTIREAATEFGIRYSTAKTIMKVYKSEGRFEKKKHRLKKGYKRCEPAVDSHSTIPSPIVKRYEVPYLQAITYGSSLPEGFWANRIAAHLQQS